MKYLDPKTDLTFKKVFGRHPDLLMSLLNALLPLSDDEQIQSIKYLPNELVPELYKHKNSIVDVLCEDVRGRKFCVEMQMEWTTAFKQRVLFNASKLYITQAMESESYEQLQPVYSLNLVNDIFEPNVPEFIHNYQIVHDKYSNKVIKGLQFTFIELPKFTPKSTLEKKMAVLWLRFLTEIGKPSHDVAEDLISNPEINKALEEVKISAFSEEELRSYDKFLDIVRTEKTMQDGKFEEGKAEGRAEGRAEGIAEGIEKGRAEGIAEGIEKGKAEEREEMLKNTLNSARSMLADGLSLEKVMLYTNLSKEQIEKLL